MALTLWIFLISPLLAISLCVVAKCCILTHKSWINKYGKKDEESESESDDDLGFFSSHKCRNNRRKLGNGATRNKQKQKQKYAKVKENKRKSSKAPLLQPFNWDDLFPKYNAENETRYLAGATHGQSQNRRTSHDHLRSRPVTNNYHGNRYGVFDKRKNTSSRSSYGCYTNYGRRISNDPESAQDVDMNRNRSNRNELPCRSDMSRQPTNRGASRRSGPSNYSNPGGSTDNRRSIPRNHSNTYEKATHVNLQTSDITNSCVQRNNELTAALRYTVNLPPLNGVTTTTNQVNNDHYSNQVNLDNLLYASTFQLTSSCSSPASSYQQQCFCDSSLHISLRCRQCQANWLADPAWHSRRSLLAPSSSDSQESERALSIDSKMWHTPTPPPPYDEALNAPERIHRIDFNNEFATIFPPEPKDFGFPGAARWVSGRTGPPPYNSVYHLNTNTLPFSIATQAIQPDVIR